MMKASQDLKLPPARFLLTGDMHDHTKEDTHGYIK